MERLITLSEGKAHLGITTPPGHVDDPALQLKLDAAQLFVVNYVGRTAARAEQVAAWDTPDATPADVKHATLVMFAEFFRFRGDDADFASERAQRAPGEDAPAVVVGLLRRYCDPVLQ
jgi:gp6-like head-tail connector protein